MDDKLLKFVKNARKDFESKSIELSLLKEIYSSYNPEVVDVDSFISKARDTFPVGNCGLASAYLQHILGKGEVIRGKYDGIPHTFLLIDEIIIDITADQFGGPEIYAGPIKEPWSL